MKWIEIDGTHINTNNLDGFYWKQGDLYLVFNADPKPTIFKDPTRALYLKTCRLLGVRPDMEDRHG